MNEKTYLIVQSNTIMAVCYSKKEVSDRLKELLNVKFKTVVVGNSNPYDMTVSVDVWIGGKYTGHSYESVAFEMGKQDKYWDYVLKSEWFYKDNDIKIYESCAIV